MPKKLLFVLLISLTALVLAVGCKPQTASQTPTLAPYFATPFQSESQFIVEAIASDLAEQIFYAVHRQLPEANHFSVNAAEKADSPPDAPVYEVRINLDPKIAVKRDLSVPGPIWAPAAYHDLATALARTVGLKTGAASKPVTSSLLAKLLDGTPETIERENQSLSDALEKDFTNPELHEQAALLLGAFLLRDHSGHFFEIRSPLSRLTAHLAMARCLRGKDSPGVNGQLAEAILLTLAGDQAPALEQVKTVGTNDAAVTGLVRALRARNTGDFRPLADVADPSPVESVVWFATLADYVSAPIAWRNLEDEQKETVDFIRVANEMSYSVEMGHELLKAALPLEVEEIESIYQLAHGQEVNETNLIEALNELPERCFSHGADQKARVRIIGWGQWASFFQRHVCHAIQQNYYFLRRKWGVPEYAQEYAAQNDGAFSGLRLYPFVRRFNCATVEAYHQSVDDGYKVTVATPHLVPAECWNSLWRRVSFAPAYPPNANPYINEWHSHNPPPGTVYNLNPRLIHPSLIGRPDIIDHFEQLHQLAPYDLRISRFLIEKKYNDRPTYEQAMGFYGPLLPYSVSALSAVAATVEDKPDQYEKLMLQAAELNPACYYDLASYARRRDQEDKAAQYTDKACENDPDSVRVASHAEWRVRYYLKQGKIETARAIADFAGEVYSSAGLTAKAVFMEATTNYNAAFEWYARIEERYNQPGPLIAFCQRYKALTGDTRFDAVLERHVNSLFPDGMEKVSPGDFQGAPTDGVLIQQQNDLLLSAGLKKGDVIVALDGIRVHTFTQYNYVRDGLTTPELKLIVWQGDAYREITASPPNHRFGVNFGNYRPKAE